MPTILIAGNRGGSNVGASLNRAAAELGWDTVFADVQRSFTASRILNGLHLRLRNRLPPRWRSFQDEILGLADTHSPAVVLTTGLAPVTVPVLEALHRRGIRTIHFSTDDPWSPYHLAAWHHRALVAYDAVFTPRRANLEDFRRLGCASVHYLPFAYDVQVFENHGPEGPANDPGVDVLFVGGADPGRVGFFSRLAALGVHTTLVGGYWERYSGTRRLTLGPLPPHRVAALTQRSKVNLCLVRRANRDGHVMRTFEIGALGGCMVAEDTAEHREILGPEGESVRYFVDPPSAAAAVRELVDDPGERARLGESLRGRILGGGHDYASRLACMLKTIDSRTMAAGKAQGG